MTTLMHMQRAALAELLNAFTPSDTREAGYQRQMLEVLTSAADPFSRDNYEPGHFTASAFVLSPTRSELLLIFHSKLQRWLQPGGHIDPSDGSTLQAARREVLEETGLGDLPALGAGLFDLDVHTIPARGSAPSHLHLDLRYLFVAERVEARAGSDALATRWVPLREVSEVESDESVVRAVRKLLAT